MKTKTPMRILTAQLGLKLSKRTPKTTPVLATLLDGLTDICIQYPDHKSIKVIRESEEIEAKAEELFDRIGSRVWPDLDKKTKFPTWLLNPSYKVSKLAEHYPRHLQYSNHADRAILAELFYPFVCGRLQNSVNKAGNRSKSDKRPGSKHHPSSEKPSTPEDNDVFAGDNTTENRDNNFADPSSPRAASSERESNILLSAGRREMPPNIAPVASMVPGQSSMNNRQTEPFAANTVHTHSKSRQNTKQLKRSEKDRLDQLRSGSARSYACSPKTGMAGLPFHTSPGTLSTSEQSQSYPPQHRKRPFIDGTPVSSTKRSKTSANVHISKPSLIVTLKLTSAKDASNQDNTAPPQQPHIRMPSPELPPLDDIITWRSMAPFDLLDGTTRDQRSTLEPDRTPDGIQAYDMIDPIQSVDSRVLGAMDEHAPPDPAPSSRSVTLGPTGQDVFASHNASDSQHNVVPQRHQPLPDSEPRVDTEVPAVNTQHGIAHGTLTPMVGAQQAGTLTQNAANNTDLPILVAAVPETGSTATAPNSNSEIVPRSTAPLDSSSHSHGALDIELDLWVDGKIDLNLAEPDAWLELTELTSREELFRLGKVYLQESGHLEADDEIVAIIFKCADGGFIPGTRKTSVPIARVGIRDMWKRLLEKMSEAGTWKGEMRGYVRVQKAVLSK